MAKVRKARRVSPAKSRPGLDTVAKVTRLLSETTESLALELRQVEKRAEGAERKLEALQLRLAALLSEPQRETAHFCFPQLSPLAAEAEYACNLLDITWEKVKDLSLTERVRAVSGERIGN